MHSKIFNEEASEGNKSTLPFKAECDVAGHLAVGSRRNQLPNNTSWMHCPMSKPILWMDTGVGCSAVGAGADLGVSAPFKNPVLLECGQGENS